MFNPALPSLRIFVVDGHPDTRATYKSYLEQSGHTVFLAGSMAEALATLPAARCDVLICELRLPDGDGWQLLGQLDGTRPRYTVAATVFGKPEDREKSRLAGFRHHLLKPFQPWQLEAMLDEAVRELGRS